MQTFAPDETWAPSAKSGASTCCKDAQNLVTVLRDEKLQVRQCRVCERKHYRAFATMPGSVKVSG